LQFAHLFAYLLTDLISYLPIRFLSERRADDGSNGSRDCVQRHRLVVSVRPGV